MASNRFFVTAMTKDRTQPEPIEAKSIEASIMCDGKQEIMQLVAKPAEGEPAAPPVEGEAKPAEETPAAPAEGAPPAEAPTGEAAPSPAPGNA